MPSRVPTQPPTIAPTKTPSTAPSDPPTEAPSLVPTNSPTHSPSNAPSNAPTTAPTPAPTTAPISIAEEGDIGTVFFLTYVESVDDPLNLRLAIYAEELAYAVMQTLIEVSRNDSGWLAVCGDYGSNKTASEAIASFCDGKYQLPITITDNDNRRRLQDESSLEISTADDYSFGVENGTITWWKGRIVGFELCVVLNLVWNPGTCTEDIPFDEILEEIENEGDDSEYLAVGTFFTAADYGEFEYESYIRNKFNESSFTNSLTNFVRKNSWTMLAPDKFVAEQVFLGTARPARRIAIDTFQNAAIDIMLGLYGFMGMCTVAALAATFHACHRGADNVSLPPECFLITILDDQSLLVYLKCRHMQQFSISFFILAQSMRQVTE